MGIALDELVRWWDDYLRLAAIEDYPGALNGLQVEGTRPVTRIGAATDACQRTIELAAESGCEILLVHHGIFWDGPGPLTGLSYRRVAALLGADVALYSAHLPLDVHEEVGNNVLLAEALGLPVECRFGAHKEMEGLGVIVRADLAREELADRVSGVTGEEVLVIPGGGERIERLAIVTGGAGSMIAQAHAAKADAFLTRGEPSHVSRSDGARDHRAIRRSLRDRNAWSPGPGVANRRSVRDRASFLRCADGAVNSGSNPGQNTEILISLR